MSSIRSLAFAATLIAMSATAVATPVNVTSVYWEWKIDNAVATQPSVDLQIGDAYVRGNREDYDSTYQAVGVTGDSLSRVQASMRTGTIASDDQFSFGASADISVLAQVSASAVDGLAYSGARLDRFIVSFEVLEPVLYTGTLSLAAGDATFFPSEPMFVSGSILQPGLYFNTSVRLLDLVASATAGQAFHFNQSGRYDYDFVSVPEPPAVALLLLGLVGIALRRRSLGARN